MNKRICVLCKKDYKEFGNNAYPLAEGQCCDKCNNSKVIPRRLLMSKAKI
jgi:hydrogenase maturation factor HypF (carbamoyltransferase family)